MEFKYSKSPPASQPQTTIPSTGYFIPIAMVTLSGVRKEMESLRAEFEEYRNLAAMKRRDLWAHVAKARSMNEKLKQTVDRLEEELKQVKDQVDMCLTFFWSIEKLT